MLDIFLELRSGTLKRWRQDVLFLSLYSENTGFMNLLVQKMSFTDFFTFSKLEDTESGTKRQVNCSANLWYK